MTTATTTRSSHYRDAEVGAAARLRELLAERRAALAHYGDGLVGLRHRRRARVIAGGVGLAGAAVWIALTLAQDTLSAPALAGAVAASVLAYAMARAWPAAQLASVADEARDSRRPSARLSRLEARGPVREAARRWADVWPRASVALPLMAVAMLAPLAMHLAALSGAAVAEGRAMSPREFGKWAVASFVVVGHAHVALAVMGARMAHRLQKLDEAVTRHDPLIAYGVTVGKKFVGDPDVWELVDGRLFLNLDTFGNRLAVTLEVVAVDLDGVGIDTVRNLNGETIASVVVRVGDVTNGWRRSCARDCGAPVSSVATTCQTPCQRVIFVDVRCGNGC